jgi:DNA mismatch endonuclease (patch repair protein)
MKAIRGRGNETTELAVARLLRRWGLKGWRRHLSLSGRPDFTWRRERVVLFVDGCFWHGCPRCYSLPRSNTAFWREKLEGNRRRDRRISRILRAAGWKVLRVWECQVTSRRTKARILQTVLQRGAV